MKPKPRVWTMVAVVAGLLGLEGLASVILAIRGVKHAEIVAMANCRFDPDLGWKTVENASGRDDYGKGRSVTTGPDGERLFSTDEHAAGDPYRICFLGDSFTFGYKVDDDETIAARIETLDPQIETVNLGVNGYGLDQCWLRWERSQERWPCDMVLVGLIGSDLYRMEFRAFSGLEKPVVQLRDGELAVTGLPLTDHTREATRGRFERFLAGLAIVRTTNVLFHRLGIHRLPPNLPEYPAASGREPAAGEIARAILQEFHAQAGARGQVFGVFYMPRWGPLADEPTVAAIWLADVAREVGFPFFDLTAAFSSLDVDEAALCFARDSHFTARGQALAAQALLAGLRRQVPAVPGGEK